LTTISQGSKSGENNAKKCRKFTKPGMGGGVFSCRGMMENILGKYPLKKEPGKFSVLKSGNDVKTTVRPKPQA